MKAVLLDAHGDVGNFRLAEIPTPTPGPGQVLVRIAASSVNPVDVKIRKGGRSSVAGFPLILGCDVAGVVEDVGLGVTGFAAGDRVYGCVGGVGGLPGTYAEYVVADARLLAKAPANLPLRQAAALPLVTITAWEGLVDKARIGAGDRVLVLGGAGGVGHVAIQVAKMRGARVVAAVSSPEKADLARYFGADETVNYREEAVDSYAPRLTGGRGFDVVFDTTGGSDPGPAFTAARLNGQVVVIVAAFTADLMPMHSKALSLHAVMMPIPLIHNVGRERHGDILRQAAALSETGRLRPLIDPRSFALADVAEAHTHLESGRAVGKVVIDVAPDLG